MPRYNLSTAEKALKHRLLTGAWTVEELLWVKTHHQQLLPELLHLLNNRLQHAIITQDRATDEELSLTPEPM